VSNLEVPSSRELLDDWLAVLTLIGTQSELSDEEAELMARAIGRHSLDIELESTVSPRDNELLAEFTSAIGELFNRQAKVHWLVEERLIDLLGQATGESRSDIVQRLALELAGDEAD
jgi:hypothetical protein